MRLGYTGDVAIAVEELESLIADLSLSSALVVIAVVVVIILYYRWSRSVAVLIPPLLFAAVLAFAVASLPPFRVTTLNSNTAFLGSIIVGNGINFAIILLARYVEERRRGQEANEALVTAVWSTRVGTISAALGAAVSYASLVSTQFRGFRQFGIIGGLGMLFAWIVANATMPPLIVWLDRGRGVVTRNCRREATHFVNRLAGEVEKHRVAFAVVGLLVTAFALAKVGTFGHDQLEYDVSKLRRHDTWKVGEGYWGRRMDVLLGRYLTPTVMLSDTREQARAIGDVLHAESQRPPLAEMISQITTIDDVLPPHQPERIAIAKEIRADMTPKLRSLVPAEKREELDRLLGGPTPEPITLSQLPRSFTTGLVERDGTAGRTVLVFPRPSRALWEGPPLIAFVSALRGAAETSEVDGRPARVAGSLPLSADILNSIEHDGPLASSLAFVGVVLVVLVLFRRQSTTLYVIGSLAVGVVWMTAATMVLGVKVNFANFIAFPITFGIGVDYAVNVMSRYVQDGRRDIALAVSGTGSAVALCSLTTIIGYSSLLVAENRALFLFGVVAVLGEIACLSAALTLLPAIVSLIEHRRSHVLREEHR
jgi:uncharacterized membrane protein YdfJ with MMPL/SSD domain